MIRATFRTAPARSVCFDLESRPSAYWFGDKTTAEITAFGWKWRDEPAARSLVLTRTGRFADDAGKTVSYRDAYLLFRDVLLDASLVYGHNIRRFDLPLFQAGLLRQQLPPLEQLRTTDTLRDYPKRVDMSASLANLAAVYRLDDDGKLHLTQTEWEQANRLDPSGVETARRRVVSDVLLQERLRDRLLELNVLRDPRAWKP